MDSLMFLAGLHGDTAIYANLPTDDNDITTILPSLSSSATETVLNATDQPPLSTSILTTITPATAAAVVVANHTIPSIDGKTISMANFYTAFVQCFGVIICGYIAGRLKIISNAETKGLSTFVGTFALPSLIFLSLVELDWSTISWRFLLAMLVSKAVVFMVVLIIALFAVKPLNYGRAGLLGIFCTQSNDFAIGYPIVMALYKDIHPEYVSYLYLMAPVSLAILNPVGLVLMEIDKISKDKLELAAKPPLCSQTCSNERSNNKRRIRCLNERSLCVFNMIRSLFFNPLLMMTVLGTVGAFVFPQGLPEVVTGVLRVLGQSFSATALFLLGLKIVGQGSTLRGSGFLLPGILILVKILVLPLVCRQTVNIMQAGTDFNDTTELSTYAFLYGTLPSAPGAFVIATQYNIEADLMAKSIVLCTFMSGPLIFISAKMISLTNLNPIDYFHELDNFSFDVSVAGIGACLWMLLLLIVTKRYRRLPHRITFCLVISQLMCCVGVVLWSKLEHVSKWLLCLQFLIFNIGVYSSRLWTGILAISLLFLQCRSLCFVLKLWPYMIVFAWGLPSILTALLLIFDADVMADGKHNAIFQYGTTQAVISVFMLVMCFIVTVGCLVMHQRYKRRHDRYLNYSRDLSQPETESSDLQSTVSTTNLLTNSNRNLHHRRRFASNTSSSDSDEDDIENCERTTSNTSQPKKTFRKSCDGSNTACCSTSTTPSSPTNATVILDIEDLYEPCHRTTSNRNPISTTNASQIQSQSTEASVAKRTCGSGYNCSASTSRNCRSIVERYEEHLRNGLEPLEHTNDMDEQQILKHTVLLIFLLCSMFVSLAVSIWTLVMEGMSGIYLELSFLDAFLNFGQSLIVTAVFITDTGDFLMPLIKLWRKIWYGANVVNLPHWSQLSSETKHICEQFCNHHVENCKKDIVKDRRWRMKTYRKVFYGCEFVDWLIEVGLSKDRLEAVHYAKHLVDGRVLCHINNVYHFEDKQLLYHFCSRL